MQNVKKCVKCQVNEPEEGGCYCEGCDAESRAWSCFRVINADLSIKKDRGNTMTPALITLVENHWIKWYTPCGVSTSSSWYKLFREKIRSLRNNYNPERESHETKKGGYL